MKFYRFKKKTICRATIHKEAKGGTSYIHNSMWSQPVYEEQSLVESR